MLGQLYRCFKILLSKFKKETLPIQVIEPPSVILREPDEAREITESPNAELIPKFEAVFTGLMENSVDDFKVLKENNEITLSEIVPEAVAEPLANTENYVV